MIFVIKLNGAISIVNFIKCNNNMQQTAMEQMNIYMHINCNMYNRKMKKKKCMKMTETKHII